MPSLSSVGSLIVRCSVSRSAPNLHLHIHEDKVLVSSTNLRTSPRLLSQRLVFKPCVQQVRGGDVHVYPRMRGALGQTSLNMTGHRGRVRPMVAWFGGVRFVRVVCACFSFLARVRDWITADGLRYAKCELKEVEVWASE